MIVNSNLLNEFNKSRAPPPPQHAIPNRASVSYYRNKYREGDDCLDIEDRGWVV